MAKVNNLNLWKITELDLILSQKKSRKRLWYFPIRDSRSIKGADFIGNN